MQQMLEERDETIRKAGRLNPLPENCINVRDPLYFLGSWDSLNLCNVG